MRVTCPCGCGHRFDVPNREVLAAAERITANRRAHVEAEPHSGPEVNGNVLSPDDAEGRRLREEGIRRRLREAAE